MEIPGKIKWNINVLRGHQTAHVHSAIMQTISRHSAHVHSSIMQTISRHPAHVHSGIIQTISRHPARVHSGIMQTISRHHPARVHSGIMQIVSRHPETDAMFRSLQNKQSTELLQQRSHSLTYPVDSELVIQSTLLCSLYVRQPFLHRFAKYIA